LQQIYGKDDTGTLAASILREIEFLDGLALEAERRLRVRSAIR